MGRRHRSVFDTFGEKGRASVTRLSGSAGSTPPGEYVGAELMRLRLTSRGGCVTGLGLRDFTA